MGFRSRRVCLPRSRGVGHDCPDVLESNVGGPPSLRNYVVEKGPEELEGRGGKGLERNLETANPALCL